MAAALALASWALVASALAPARAAAGAEPTSVAAAPRATVALVPSARPETTRAIADGLRLALDVARDAGTADLDLVVGADGTAWSSVASTAVELARTPGVIALVTPPERRLAHPVAQLGTRAQVPVLSTSPAASVLATGSTWVTGVTPTDAASAESRDPARAPSRDAQPHPPVFDAATPAASAFVDAWRARHEDAPDAWSAVGYEAGRRIALAVGRANRRGAELAAALAAHSERDGGLFGDARGAEGSEGAQSAEGGSSR